MTILNYSLVDVFTSTAFGGNQLAVFHDERPLPPETMQKIARELNLSETVFIQPPADSNNQKSLRIFTPKVELPMAGHPTIGAAYVLAAAKKIPVTAGKNDWVFEEQVGEIPISVYEKNGQIEKVEMTQPLPAFGSVYSKPGLVADLLSLSVKDFDQRLPLQSVSSGVPFLYVPVRTLSAMKKIKFRSDIWEKHFSTNPHTQHIFVFTFETVQKSSTVHSRMFAPAMGIPEDPATGAASGPLGAYLVENGVVAPSKNQFYHIRSEQGFEMERPSFIDITVDKSKGAISSIKIGGNVASVGTGQLQLSN